jgi:hypothetical protein
MQAISAYSNLLPYLKILERGWAITAKYTKKNYLTAEHSLFTNKTKTKQKQNPKLVLFYSPSVGLLKWI